MSFVEILDHSDYEILNEYPFTIRRKYDNYEPVETFNKDGYPEIALNGNHYRKHRIIALQFIENDDPKHKTQVDHINHNKSDYHIENLRWVTPSENQLNRTGHKGNIKYEFVDDIPEEAFVIDTYETRNGMRYFDKNRYFYYYDDENDDDIFYGKVKDDLYRRLHININKYGNRYVNTLDVNHKVVAMCLTKFKHQYNLI